MNSGVLYEFFAPNVSTDDLSKYKLHTIKSSLCNTYTVTFTKMFSHELSIHFFHKVWSMNITTLGIFRKTVYLQVGSTLLQNDCTYQEVQKGDNLCEMQNICDSIQFLLHFKN
jgi:hypothetical protein